MSRVSGYGPEPGRRADAERIIDIINRATTRTGARNVDAELSKSLCWDTPRHRRHVREASDDVDEAIPRLR